MKKYFPLLLLLIIAISCKKDDGDSSSEEGVEPRLIIKIKFDSTQVRLGATGQVESVPVGNAAQTPKFYGLSAHFIELTPNAFTLPQAGEMIYKGTTVNYNSEDIIDFDKAVIKSEGEVFTSVPLKDVSAGTYEYLRVSVTYQNYDVKFRSSGFDLTGRIASFVGFNTYLSSYTINNESVTVNDSKKQGYWGFETVGNVITGQAPVGATTVVNPISNTSPIPVGSCLVTGEFLSPLTISGTETEDVEITLSFSINDSFEWKDDGNGIFEPAIDTVVDMGLRGVIPYVN